jgi:hypothetical protein
MRRRSAPPSALFLLLLSAVAIGCEDVPANSDAPASPAPTVVTKPSKPGARVKREEAAAPGPGMERGRD